MKLVAENINEAIKHLKPKTGDELPNIEYDVKAYAVNRYTGISVSPVKVERIKPRENKIFKDCYTVLDVKEAYENFWNHLNGMSNEIVFVTEIKTIEL